MLDMFVGVLYLGLLTQYCIYLENVRANERELESESEPIESEPEPAKSEPKPESEPEPDEFVLVGAELSPELPVEVFSRQNSARKTGDCSSYLNRQRYYLYLDKCNYADARSREGLVLVDLGTVPVLPEQYSFVSFIVFERAQIDPARLDQIVQKHQRRLAWAHRLSYQTYLNSRNIELVLQYGSPISCEQAQSTSFNIVHEARLTMSAQIKHMTTKMALN